MSDNYLLYDPAVFGALEIKEDTRDAEILRLRAENEKLRAALKPFAVIADTYHPNFDDDHLIMDDGSLSLGDLRAAKAALGEGDE